MRLSRFLFPLLILFLLVSCSDQPQPHKVGNWQTGKVYNKVSILKDTSLSYALYLPNSYKADEENKIIFLFDAHANGTLPVNKYHALAEKHRIILAASNDSKNGLSGTARNHIITTFIDDVEQRLDIDKFNMLTGGFSGGARVASMIGVYNKNVKGIIGCGAGFPGVQHFKNKEFIWVGIVGNKDFNYLELKNLYNQFQFDKIKSYLLVFDGKHEWPPEEVMDEALGIILEGKTDKLKYEDKYASVIDPLEDEEIEKRDMLIQSFNSKDLKWWNNEIFKLKNNAKNATTREVRLMNARLLSYLGIVCYMFTEKAVKIGNDEETEKYLKIYENIEPDNPDMFYFKAVYFAKNHKNKAALTALKLSVEHGLDDLSKIKTEKAFSGIRKDPEFKKILAEEK